MCGVSRLNWIVEKRRPLVVCREGGGVDGVDGGAGSSVVEVRCGRLVAAVWACRVLCGGAGCAAREMILGMTLR